MSSTKEGEEELVDVKEASIKSEDEASPTAATDATQKNAAKRRTKTGCLTCRKRRIKCGEEKPVCRNCVKSKRDCAGYAQPLGYKQQAQGHGDVNNLNVDHYSFHEQNATRGLNLRWHSEQQHHHPAGHVYPQSEPSPYNSLPFGASYHAVPFLPNSVPHLAPGSLPNSNYGWQSDAPFENQPPIDVFNAPANHAPAFGLPSNHVPNLAIHPQLDIQVVNQQVYPNLHPYTDHTQSPAEYTPGRHFFPAEHPYPIHPQQRSISLSHHRDTSPALADEHAARRFSAHAGLRQPNYAPIAASGLASIPSNEVIFRDDVYDDPEDPFDVEMDDPNLSYHDAANNLTDILGRSGQPNFATSKLYVPRRTEYKSLATPGNSIAQSPLRDERNEQIFCHFVEITSNTMSIYERHHFSPIAAPARTLWNFTIPALALGHAALAHAMLALGALHLAKLNNTSENLAIKHFTYAVRRVGKLLGLPQRRHETTTLATVMLLGYYEVVAGDHSRWNLHLSGAARLVLEHDFAGLIRTTRRMRAGAKARLSQWTAQFALTDENYARVAGIPLTLLDDADWEVDSAFISRLIGVQVDYDHQFQPNFSLRATKSSLSEKDVEELKTQMSLRWWYCKQDIFQSMVSGDPPLMPLENWIYCPPRGQFGRVDAPYATFDHLLLVMARLCDFGAKDRGRKQRAVAAQGGRWRPPKWLFGPKGPPMPPAPPGAVLMSVPSDPSLGATVGQAAGNEKSVPLGLTKTPAPSANEGRARQSRPGAAPDGAPTGLKSASGPPMLGMMPPPSSGPQLNSAEQFMDTSMRDPAFTVKQEQNETSPPKNLEDDTIRAMSEYNEIVDAFDLFAQSLGPEFEPLKNIGNPLPSPFGPSLVYKNASIACIWACYLMGRISLQRLHPEMPPAAMVAAGVTQHLTREHAHKVGKICAGLYGTQQYGQTGALDPSFAGALMESTIFLLFAGIQYTDAAQRGWTISKLKDVERRCGWRTSGAIAAACETAWERMAQAGRGPAYERTRDIRNKDARVSGISSKSDNSASSTKENGATSVDQHESEFVNHDRSLIDRSSSTRVHWALGLLSVEEDIKSMTLEDD